MKSNLLFAILLSCAAASAQPGILDSDFSADGKLSFSFFNNTPDTAYAMLVQPDNKILVAGATFNGTQTVGAIARLDEFGDFDGSFGANGKVIIDFPATAENISVKAMALQDDDKIVVAGAYRTTLANTFFVARYLPNGTMDSSFNSVGYALTGFGSGASEASCLAIQPDQKIIAGGRYYNGTDYDVALVRYLSNGKLDSTFSGDGKLTTNVYQFSSITSDDFIISIKVLSGNKILATGYSSPNAFGSNDMIALVKYTESGNLDISFDGDGKTTLNINDEDYRVYAAEVLANNKLLLAGSGKDSFVVVRVKDDGVIDSTFGKDGVAMHSMGNYTRQQANAIAVQADNKIVVGGFRSTSGLPGFTVLRLKSNGEADSTFGNKGFVNHGFGSGTQSGLANAIAIQSNGRILAAGFGDSNPDSDFAVARYLSGLNVNIQPISDELAPITAYPNPAQHLLYLQLPEGVQDARVTIFSADARRVLETQQMQGIPLDVSSLSKGVYLAEVNMGSVVQKVRWIKM